VIPGESECDFEYTMSSIKLVFKYFEVKEKLYDDSPVCSEKLVNGKGNFCFLCLANGKIVYYTD
jgi:hypothetical protein